jgi:hypothetical protein
MPRLTSYRHLACTFSLASTHNPRAIGQASGPVPNGVDLSFWVARPKRSEGRGLLRARKTHLEICDA